MKKLLILLTISLFNLSCKPFSIQAAPLETGRGDLAFKVEWPLLKSDGVENEIEQDYDKIIEDCKSKELLYENDNGNVFAYSIDDSISETYAIKNVGKVAEVVYFQGSKPEIKTDINQSIYKYAYSGAIK